MCTGDTQRATFRRLFTQYRITRVRISSACACPLSVDGLWGRLGDGARVVARPLVALAVHVASEHGAVAVGFEGRGARHEGGTWLGLGLGLGLGLATLTLTLTLTITLTLTLTITITLALTKAAPAAAPRSSSWTEYSTSSGGGASLCR